MSSVQVSRHFVAVPASDGERQILYRKAGSGPLIVMIHQSPTSSEEYEPLMKEWGQNFTVIAPDTPGYGLSDPINIDKPAITDFAKGLGEFLTALGIDKAAFYGMHTGSKVVVEYARLFPERTLAIYAEGVMFLTQEEKGFINGGYFADFTPQPEGGHLPKIWARMRDQLIFFPWFDRTPSGRMIYDVAPPDRLETYVVNLLRAGKNEPDAYAAAFNYTTADALVALTVPAFIAFSKPDPLSAQIPRMPPLPDCVETDLFENRDVSDQKAIEYLAKFAAPCEVGVGSAKPNAGGIWKEIVRTDGGEISLRRAGKPSDKRPVLILHAVGSSSTRTVTVIDEISRTREVIAPDFPGHGDTGGTTFSMEITVDGLIALLDHLQWDQVDVLAFETGGQIAADLANKTGARIGRIVIDEPWLIDQAEKDDLAENIIPPMEPTYYGGYLLAVWYALRDGELFWPWYNTTKEHAIQRPAHIDPQDLQDRLCEFLKAKPVYPSAITEVIRYDQTSHLNGLDQEVLFVAESLSPHAPQAKSSADLVTSGRFLERRADLTEIANVALKFFDSE